MRKSALFLFISLIGLMASGQNDSYRFTYISSSEGLSQSTVIAVEQDALGQMWIGTRDGLNKFDGTKFTIYRTRLNDSTSISNNDILSLKEDKNGLLWVGTYNGLNKYNPKTNVFTRYFRTKNEKSLSNNTIWAIEEMENGDLWIGTSMGLSIFDKTNQTFKNIYKTTQPNSISSNHILSILELKNQNVYIGTTNGLSVYYSDKKIFQTIENTSAYYIQDLIKTKEGNILLATRENGILSFDPELNSIVPFESDVIGENNLNNIRQLVYDNEDNLWIGTYNGLGIFNQNKEFIFLQNKLNEPGSLSKNSVKTLFKDKKESIWIGTYYGGINIWDKSNTNFKAIQRKSYNTGLNYEVVSSIEKHKDNIYFGTEGGGLNIYNTSNENFTYINADNSPKLSNNNIKDLYLSKDNLMWIGTLNSGINILNLSTNTFEDDFISEDLKNELKDIGVYSMVGDDQNNMWFGTFGKGLLKYNLIDKSIISYNYNEGLNSLSSNLIRTLFLDDKNNLWIGTEKGLNLLDTKGRITQFFYDSAVQSGEDILSIFQDSKDNIWVGSKSKGLYKYENGVFKTVDIKDNTTKINTVHSILEGNQNDLWISTNQGLVKFNLEDENTTFYNQTDGLVSNEFNGNASLKTSDNLLYFGGPNGVVYFNADNLKTNQYAPQVVLTDFKINNKSVSVTSPKDILEKSISYTKNVELNYNQGNFSVSFSIPNFINASNNKYKYRLNNLEKEWVETKSNTATYTIQKAGNYTFEVYGANSGGVWNETPTQLNIRVNPAPWQSWWAFLLYAVLILTALFFLMRILKSRTKLQTELQLEHLEVERTKKINKAKLEFFTNISHEFRTPLTLILGPLNQIILDYKGSSKMYKQLLVMESSVKHLLQLINRLMDFRKFEKNIYTLESAEGNIVKFLREIYLSFSEHAKIGEYDYTFHTTDDEILVYYDRYKLERVFYNLISNAFRYTPKGGSISLRIINRDKEIEIKVEDSGVGISKENQEKIFNRFFEVSTNRNPEQDYNQGTGIGLAIAKNIVKIHKGKITVENNLNGKGTVFTVVLPLGRTHIKDEEIIKDFKFSDDISQYTNQLEEDLNTIDDELPNLPASKSKATILLVEDNKPLRKFMRSLLEEDYNIIEAENGKKAMNSAIKNSPDLIVSDVIMPVMVGTELCSSIKNDIRTSHIPIILLTSRTALVYKIEGLESGADDYISKPFNINEFKLRIKNILSSTSKLKEKFTNEDPLQPNEVIVSSLDEKLYKKSLKIVEENISNEQFDIPFFCSELGVSRTMLFVKIKAWTNFTPNEFIQHFRMKRATQLLEQGKINISQVSYKVGFKNPKYFSKCFQKKFGQTPTQYANKFSKD
jgi:signal transduction histidine kinase/ligand-binding sensor domain-containing protein/DNA-binding response OmpR family regulator